jgi:hypothetical protein
MRYRWVPMVREQLRGKKAGWLLEKQGLVVQQGMWLEWRWAELVRAADAVEAAGETLGGGVLSSVQWSSMGGLLVGTSGSPYRSGDGVVYVPKGDNLIVWSEAWLKGKWVGRTASDNQLRGAGIVLPGAI